MQSAIFVKVINRSSWFFNSKQWKTTFYLVCIFEENQSKFAIMRVFRKKWRQPKKRSKQQGLRPANVPAAPRAGLWLAGTRFSRCARPGAPRRNFDISAILTRNEASTRLNRSKVVISMAIVIEKDTLLALFQKDCYWWLFYFVF